MFLRLAPPKATRIAIRNIRPKKTKKPQTLRELKGQATMSVIAWPHFTGNDAMYTLSGNPQQADRYSRATLRPHRELVAFPVPVSLNTLMPNK